MIATHKGARLDLQHYKGESIQDFEFEMCDDSGVALNLGIYTNIKIQIFAKRGGTLIRTWDNNSGLTITLNVINWDATKIQMDEYRRLTYYHHCIGVLSTGQEDVLFYGNSEVI
jgi:hypothetical protein